MLSSSDNPRRLADLTEAEIAELAARHIANVRRVLPAEVIEPDAEEELELS